MASDKRKLNLFLRSSEYGSRISENCSLLTYYMGKKNRLLNISRHAERYTQEERYTVLLFYWLSHNKLLQMFGYGETFEGDAEYSMFYSSLGKIRSQPGNARQSDG